MSAVHDIPDDERPEDDGYVAPAKVGMDELLGKDADDESLNKYKAALVNTKVKAHDPNNKKKVIVAALIIRCPGREDIVLDPKDPALTKKPYTLKEGTPFTVAVKFYVQHDIVMGLKYVNMVYKMKVRVEKATQMLGSFGPQTDAYEFACPEDHAPSGMMARGNYKARARFMDDDGDIYLDFEYAFAIKKKW